MLKLKIKQLMNFYIKRTRIKSLYNPSITIVFKKNVRIKWQIKYLFNNWIYSTNHKRISINYFWFVLLAGIVGMVLATIIRIEMAYPGVGILAGDNSQYLSIVTAHGVIMVFFMAMPLLFGFFTNFLLPTQLGVHDVAFPRMNSAAFWFLPASLIILCQLVCIDRRYQRMNCFNVRELQSLVRKRFFFELSNQKTYNETLSKTLIGSKYKTTNLNKSNSSLNYSLGLDINDSITAPYTLVTKVHQYKLTNRLTNFSLKSIFMKKNFNSRYRPHLFELIPEFDWSFNGLKSPITISYKNFFNTWFGCNYFITLPRAINEKFTITGGTSWFSNYLSSKNFNFLENSQIEKDIIFKLSNIERGYQSRYQQHQLPTTIYKVKIGDYLSEVPFSTNYNHLFNSFSKKTISNRKPTWFFSTDIQKSLNKKNLNIDNANIGQTGVFINFHNTLYSLNNIRWVNLNSFNQKFINLFLSQSKQSLALNNWKNLKLTREGWRCRMLIARNQKSLFNKHVAEKNLIWVVEKNAKDLLPGWAMITPFSSRTRYTLIGKTDIGVMVVMITLIASLVSCSNFLITYRYLSTLNNRKMRDARSFFVEAIIATCWMTLAANPMLVLGLYMLMSDRHWKTSFFDYSGGGDVVLFQHMFWFFGHPEVYIIIVPCFGLVNTMLSFYLRKRISARASLMYSMYTIAFLGFFVWGHHMYMVGLAHTTRMLYSTLTVMISVPAATKIMHWLVTFINSSIHFELPLLFVISFIFFFLSGGISGMSVAHTGMDVLFHDTFFVIGHFHVMLAGSLMFAGFGACYFYLPAIFGIKYNRFFAYLHFIYYVIGQLFTVIPMIWLGYAGMPRRVLDYPAAMGGWHSLSTSAHILSIAGILCFIIMLFDSLRKKKAYTIKTFGIGRYNTRLNFYVYEYNRTRYWQLKTNTLYNSYDVSNDSYYYISNLNSTLYFYHIKK